MINICLIILFSLLLGTGPLLNSEIPCGREISPDTLQILTFNMWLGGEGGKQPLEKSAEVIRLSNARIAGLQETRSHHSGEKDNAPVIAEILGWNYISQGEGCGIITSYEIADSTQNKLGVKLKVGDSRYIWFFNCHLFHMPYQPYQLASKAYGDYPFIRSEKEAIWFAESTRKNEVQRYMHEINRVLAEGWPVFITGDFNEPSFQDWTDAAVKAGFCPIKVEWPSTKAFAEAGFIDAFREVHPDEIAVRGETWSSIDTPGEIHDRIDFIFFQGKQLKVIRAGTIGFEDGKSDIGITDYPSDHRAVRVTFLWK